MTLGCRLAWAALAIVNAGAVPTAVAQDAVSPAQPQGTVERIAEVRVHGNASIADADVLSTAGVAVGDPLAPNSIDLITERLERSGRFDDVEVRKRYRSLTDATEVALVIIVHERPAALGGSTLTRPLRDLQRHLMYLPIVSYADGYGLTYGVRLGTLDLFGAGERLSAPLTWGATKRAALEVDRAVPRGPIDRVEASVGVSSRRNPRFGVDDHRVDLRARAERYLPGAVRVGAEIGRAHVTFGDLDDRLWTFTADAGIDTRNDPSFPRSGVLARASWTALHLPGGDGVNLYRSDVRVFRSLVGQTVLAVRGGYTSADRPLPLYERLLLGGGSLLRGYRAGSFDGDRLAILSTELRIPLSSVLGGARTGVTVFGDTGAAFEFNEPLSRARFHRGIGGGVFFSAAVFSFNVDVARNDIGRTRGHVSFGFSF